jgi:hypothetical protein
MKAGIVSGTLAFAGLVPATAMGSAGLAAVGGGPVATPSAEVESIVNYNTSGKLKVQRKIRFLATCTVNCNVTVNLELVVPGPNLKTAPLTGSFLAGQIFEGFIELNKAGRAFVKENKKKSKFRTSIAAVDPLTGNTDTDARTFKFK